MNEPNFSLSPADASHAAAIRTLIRQAKINPTGLNWRRFCVSLDQQGRLIGCGQVKPHRDGSRELASIAVVPEWRRKGVASALIRHLMRQHPPPLYLTCRASLGPFYERFGFRTIPLDEMPPDFKRISLFVRFLQRVKLIRFELLVMRADSSSSAQTAEPPAD